MSHSEYTNNVHDALDSELNKKLKQLSLLKTPERVRRKPVYLGDDEDHSHRAPPVAGEPQSPHGRETSRRGQGAGARRDDRGLPRATQQHRGGPHPPRIAANSRTRGQGIPLLHKGLRRKNCRYVQSFFYILSVISINEIVHNHGTAEAKKDMKKKRKLPIVN